MLTIVINIYCINVVVYIKPIYLKEPVFCACFFTVIKENFNLLVQRRKCKKWVQVVKNLFSNDVQFKELKS